MIEYAFERAFEKLRDRRWEKIHIAVDLHGTVIKPTYSVDIVFELYPLAEDVLRIMSNRTDICMILTTSSKPEYRIEFMKFMEKSGVVFDYHNCNPEVLNTETGCFDDGKWYYDVFIDDKAGFDPESDWLKLKQKLNR